MKEAAFTFSIHDGSVNIWNRNANGRQPFPVRSSFSPAEDWTTYLAIRAFLKEQGYSFQQCPDTRRRFRTLRFANHVGGRQDVRFHSQIGGIHIEIKFYEDAVRDNQYGGRYTVWPRMAKMPYLRRLRVKLILSKLRELLISLGATDQTEPVAKTSMDQVRLSRERWTRSHPDMFTRPYEEYNSTDRDGRQMRDGDVRYFWTHNGRLLRGTVYRNGNNMWIAVVNSAECSYQSSGCFFAWRPKHGRKLSIDSRERVGRALTKAVNSQAFERAAMIRDYINRTYGKHDLKLGMEVRVEHPRFHGTGKVEYVKALSVGVLLGNGNVWEYERSTVSPAEVTPRA